MAHPLILGNGLLGTEIKKQTGWDAISRKKNGFDFTEINTYQEYLSGYDQILNCIAYTKTYSDEKQKHWNTNYLAVCDLVDFCSKMGKKIIQISTDYVYSYSVENATEEDVPVHCRNWYGYTKLLADGYVQARSQNYLLIRTSFKPKPFPYPEAITTQVGNFDYIDRIAALVVELINAGAAGIYNVGTEKKTIYELAKRTAEVVPIDKVLHETMPINITMNLEKLTAFLKKKTC